MQSGDEAGRVVLASQLSLPAARRRNCQIQQFKWKVHYKFNNFNFSDKRPSRWWHLLFLELKSLTLIEGYFGYQNYPFHFVGCKLYWNKFVEIKIFF